MTEQIHVTGRERVLAATDRIVLATDLEGRITYVNRDFLRISGHEPPEVLGASQAILRHPDMPREPFADLMQTVRTGRTWSGLMKNRCRDGDHYWVRIDAAPVFHEGQVSGFTSIRTRPARDEVEQAERCLSSLGQGNRRGAYPRRPHPRRRCPPAAVLVAAGASGALCRRCIGGPGRSGLVRAGRRVHGLAACGTRRMLGGVGRCGAADRDHRSSARHAGRDRAHRRGRSVPPPAGGSAGGTGEPGAWPADPADQHETFAGAHPGIH